MINYSPTYEQFVYDYFEREVPIDEETVSWVADPYWIGEFSSRLLKEKLPKDACPNPTRELLNISLINRTALVSEPSKCTNAEFLFSILILLSFGDSDPVLYDYFFSIFPGCYDFFKPYEDFAEGEKVLDESDFYLLIANTLGGDPLPEKYHPRKPRTYHLN